MALIKFLFSSPVGTLLRRSANFTVCCRRNYGQPTAVTHPHLIKAGEVTPGITQNEYKCRRDKLMEVIAQNSHNGTTNHMIILPSSTKSFMTADIPYFFRQNSDFLYYTGFMEPDSLLILQGDKNKLPNYNAILFVPRRDPHRELWDGPRSGTDGAKELTGIEDTRSTDHITDYFQQFSQTPDNFIVWYNLKKPAHPLFHMKHIAEFLNNNKTKSVDNITPHVHGMRVVKSPAEIELLRKSCEITSSAFVEAMKFSNQRFLDENALQAKMDYECRLLGAQYLAYPPVVAGGDRANIIHYVINNQVIDTDEMVLVDAGCEYHSYTSDVTRTWPISGSFTNAQKVLYEIVLNVQRRCVLMCGEQDRSLSSIYSDMLLLLGQSLSSAGILKKPPGSQEELQRITRELCPHHVGHYLGMDVHDTDEVSRAQKLLPGMVITIEPGLYVSKKRKDVYDDFKGIGIRIEDDVLITDTGFDNLTSPCPKDILEIENLIQRKGVQK